MRIGLIRHFPVTLPFPTGWRKAVELTEWLRAYDVSPVTVVPVDLGGVRWSRCISSDMERAATTARTIFSGAVEHTKLLREPEFQTFRTGALRLPVALWRKILVLAWLTGHRSQRACRDDFFRRVLQMADELEAANGDVLVVSHAAMMRYLSAELLKRGFRGPRLHIPQNAVLQLYERGE